MIMKDLVLLSFAIMGAGLRGAARFGGGRAGLSSLT